MLKMKELKEFNIQFIGLKEGKHQFEYHIDNTFFKTFEYNEFNDSNIYINVDFVKKSTLIELNFSANGNVNIPCDVTGELFDQEIQGEFPLIIKFGTEFNDDNEEVLILPYEEYQVNIAQYIYELIVLSVPTKRVHPQVLNGTMQNDTLEKLKELEYKQKNTVDKTTTETDPRWDKLKDLLTGKNT